MNETAEPRLRPTAAADVDAAARRTYAVVLAGGRGARLGALTAARAKPALPFAGTLNIVDFVLSNCLNSGIRRIGVLTQYKSQSLIRHVERGWGFLQPSLGESVEVVPAQQQHGEGWYAGTADAVWQNLELIDEARAEHTLVLAGDHVYKMDYRRLLADHLAGGADATVACIAVPIAQASAFGVMRVDGDGHVLGFDEKPARPVPLPDRPGLALASMGIYVFRTERLRAALAADAHRPGSSHDFGHDVLPALVARGAVRAHPFDASCVGPAGAAPYWRDVGTLDAYWAANLDLTRSEPPLQLDDADWPIRSVQREVTPARFVSAGGLCGVVVDSLVAGGCVVEGAAVERSLLSTRVRIGRGSVVESSVVLPNVRIGREVRLRRTIVDKNCVLPDGLSVGHDAAADRRRFEVSPGGITLVTAAMLAAPGGA